ncbi:MAG: urease accessory protein UreD [Anaerolineae bacterium]|nr:urease accessory protein UreD [Anaerolineae bacterium]
MTTTTQTQGKLRLGFGTNEQGITQLSAYEHRPPLKVVRAFDAGDGAALVHLHNVSGGVLTADQLDVEVCLGEGAHAQLTTTGATRVYRSKPNSPAAVQNMHISLNSQALLEYLPDPLIPFAGANYRQDTRVEMAAGATLFWWEILAPGREAYGEQFAYERLVLRTDIRAEGRPIAFESAQVEPAVSPVGGGVRLGGYRYLATFYICRVGETGSVWSELETRLHEELARFRERMKFNGA